MRNLYYGRVLYSRRMARLPPGSAESVAGYIPPRGGTSAGDPKLALKIIERAMNDDCDIAAMKCLPRPEAATRPQVL